MYNIPTTVTVKDKTFHITGKGDYRMVLDCFEVLQNIDIDQTYRVVTSLLIFYEEILDESCINLYSDYIEGLVQEMFKFFNCGQEQSPGANSDVKLVDWGNDSQLICSAINNVAKQEIRAVEYLHWWTFLGYFMSIGQSVLSTVITIRNKIVHHKKLEKWETDFRRENPQYFNWNYKSVEAQEAEALIRELWN